MARINFSYEKRQKELARQRKKEEKRQRKQNKNNPDLLEPSTVVANEDDAVGAPPATSDQSE